MISIPRHSASDSVDDLAAALAYAGCLVVSEAADLATRDAITAELAPHMAAVRVRDDAAAAFYPGLTRRVSALVARSARVGELILHPTATALCDRFLTPNAHFGYQLHATAALEVGPGARAQVLHREEDAFTFFPLPRPNLVVATMWAIRR